MKCPFDRWGWPQAAFDLVTWLNVCNWSCGRVLAELYNGTIAVVHRQGKSLLVHRR
jgi:hypothetical protein